MNYVLGLDLGSASLGWAVLACTEVDGTLQPTRLERTGVRIFEAGVEGDIEQGRDASRAAKRREARQPRRQNWRTQQRKRTLFRMLQQHGLLPASEKDDAASRKAVFDELDKELSEKHITKGDHTAHQHLPYLLRMLASEAMVKPFELGRAIYSLAQRRGFLSNRKADTDEKEDGVVKASISELGGQMAGRTISQAFVEDISPYNEDPSRQRIRQRYTAREMFHDEFNLIRKQQQPHFDLTDEDWDKVFKAIFFQRPLKSQRHRIGRCEIDGGQRCLDALDVFQQFRIWHAVQNLRLADAYALGRDARLTLEEQQTIVDALQTKASITWSAILKLLGYKKAQAKFTIQEWNTKGLTGHRTNQAMINVFGDDWLGKPLEERDAITKEVVYFRKPSAMKKRGVEAWGLSAEQAALLPATRLEEAHARHSAATLQIFVERMSRGEDYSTIRKDITGTDDSEPVDQLPPISTAALDITNPAVIRGLTEVRKVVNELVRQYGKPTGIRIELSRSLKNSRDKRIKLHKDNEDRRKRREKAIEGILKQIPGRYSGTDIEKWLLAEECGWHCPYTGRPISPSTLIGSQPQFDIEHIYPRRYLDNSFGNKTLCYHEFNRNVKKNQTAFDACSGLDSWEEILQRVNSFDGPVAALKRKRFLTAAKDIPDGFTSKHLNDNRYNAVVAKKYVAMLYGGLSDADGDQRVFAVTGGHTALLRREWGLNSILSGTEEKTRDDHRHHAVDAVVIGLTDPARIHALVNAANLAEKKASPRFYEAVQDPWPKFSRDVTASINEIVVSHRPTRTLPGALHAESIYSKPHTDKDGNTNHRIRKHISKLSATELNKDKIVDPAIRKLVLAKLDELGESNPMKAFAEEKNHPFLTAKDGRKIPIHKVRVFADKKPRAIAKAERQRYVASGKDSNFASMIYAVVDKDGNETKWEHKVISRLEAHERKSRNHKLSGEKVLLPDPSDFDDDKQRIFKFALCKNDTVLLEGPDGEEVIYRVQQLGQKEVQLCPIEWTVMDKKLRTPWNRITSIDSLRKRNLRAIVVSPCGAFRGRK